MSDPIQASVPPTSTRSSAASVLPGEPAELVANATSPVRGFIDTQDLARCVADVAKHDPAAADRLKAGIEAQLMQHSVADVARFHVDVAAATAGHPVAGARCPVAEPPAAPTFADLLEETVELVHRHGVATGAWNPRLQPLIQYLVGLGERAQPNCSTRISPEMSFDRGAAILARHFHLEGSVARGAARGDAWVERQHASALSLREEFGGVTRNGLYGPGIVVVAETKAQQQANQEARERSRLNMFKIESDLVASLGGKAEAGPAGPTGAVEVAHGAPLEPAGRPVEPMASAAVQGAGRSGPREQLLLGPGRQRAAETTVLPSSGETIRLDVGAMAGSSRPGRHEALVGSSRDQMRAAAARIIRRTEGHPLKFLLGANGEFKPQKDLTKHPTLIDRPDLVQMGHIRSNLLGGTEYIMLQGAWENQLNNVSIERSSIGGAVIDQQAIAIGSSGSYVAVDKRTAMFWESVGLLPEATVANAKRVDIE